VGILTIVTSIMICLDRTIMTRGMAMIPTVLMKTIPAGVRALAWVMARIMPAAINRVRVVAMEAVKKVVGKTTSRKDDVHPGGGNVAVVYRPKNIPDEYINREAKDLCLHVSRVFKFSSVVQAQKNKFWVSMFFISLFREERGSGGVVHRARGGT
jgi:hypothetical protein